MNDGTSGVEIKDEALIDVSGGGATPERTWIGCQRELVANAGIVVTWAAAEVERLVQSTMHFGPAQADVLGLIGRNLTDQVERARRQALRAWLEGQK